MKYIFLSKQFYKDYEHKLFPEIEYKDNRPYIMLLMKIDGLDYAIPFRSHITHNYSFLTDVANKCGIDYTKAIIIKKHDYVVDNINGLPIKIRQKDNILNRGVNKNNILGFKGIYYEKDKKRYVARYYGKYIGRYLTLEEAVQAWERVDIYGK